MRRPAILAAILVSLAVLTAASPASAMYHPTVGKWVQRDPAGYKGPDARFAFSLSTQQWQYQVEAGPSMSRGPAAQEMSLYVYVGNSPAADRDPAGLRGCCGGDATALLEKANRLIDDKWNGFSVQEKFSACINMYGPGGWEIGGFGNWPATATPGIPSEGCKRTVVISGKCRDVDQVNFEMWGKANALCRNTLGDTLGINAVWKAAQHGLSLRTVESMAWSAHGYVGGTESLAGQMIQPYLPSSAPSECAVKNPHPESTLSDITIRWKTENNWAGYRFVGSAAAANGMVQDCVSGAANLIERVASWF
jgi:hypothetical protein